MEILFAVFAGMFFQWAFQKWIVYPRCSECAAKAMPAVHLALVRTAHKLDVTEEALRVLYEETADYIRINNLGDVHHNRSMKLARHALKVCGSGGDNGGSSG